MGKVLKRIILILAVIGALIGGVIWVASARFEASLTINKVVGDALGLANEPRTAVGVACLERKLITGQGNESLGLSPAETYNGNFTRAVRVRVEDDAHATVTVLMKEVKPYNYFDPGVREGDTFIFAGTCSSSGISWSVSGTVSKSHRRKAGKKMTSK